MSEHDAARREYMVATQIAARGIRSPAVLTAMRRVPREEFVAAGLREDAWGDRPLPIAAGQTLSQPYIVARMVEAAALGSGDLVLEVGVGSGYASAVMSLLARRVHAIERHPALADEARARLARLGYLNVNIRCGDGSLGWPDAASFDAIVVSAGGPRVPEALRAQLAVGGRLVMPVGGDEVGQRLVKLTRRGDDRFDEELLDAVRFVPLIGAQGWPEPEP